jgi:DNA-directed RNA polymerase subunit RPC12/RpoP
MEYICYACGKPVTPEDISKRIRCPYCGGKILFKKRVEVVKTVKSR